jgi:hypothetical protein
MIVLLSVFDRDAAEILSLEKNILKIGRKIWTASGRKKNKNIITNVLS